MKYQLPDHYKINKKEEREIRAKVKGFLWFVFWLIIGIITGSIIRFMVLK